MQFNQRIIIKHWKPILEEYEKIQNKVSLRSFKWIKDLCIAHHISNKELRRYFREWQEGKRKVNPRFLLKLMPNLVPPNPPKPIERNIMKAYRKSGSNRYELVLLFKSYYLDKTPSPATMDRIKRRYPLNEKEKKIVKHYEKVTPGELAHIDLTKIPKDLRAVFKIENRMSLPWKMIVPASPMQRF